MAKKVLCLHGYAMDSDWLSQWLMPMEEMSDGRLQLVFPQGPIEPPPEEVQAIADLFGVGMPESRIGPGKNWCWFRATSDKPPHYRGIEKTLDDLAQVFEREGPFDGVLGWSQGAVLTAILAALMVRGKDDRFAFNWAVMCGGFRPGDIRYRPLFDTPLSLPSLHVIGTKESEFILQQAAVLKECFVDSDRLDTPVGHVMPVSKPDYMQHIVDWMSTH